MTLIPRETPRPGLGIEKKPENLTFYDALLGGAPLQSTILKTDCDGLDLAPADKNLVAANLDMVDLPDREFRLRTLWSPYGQL